HHRPGHHAPPRSGGSPEGLELLERRQGGPHQPVLWSLPLRLLDQGPHPAEQGLQRVPQRQRLLDQTDTGLRRPARNRRSTAGYRTFRGWWNALQPRSNSRRIWLTRAGLRPRARATSFVLPPAARASSTALALRPNPDRHRGKSSRNATWAGTGVRVFSASTSASSSPSSNCGSITGVEFHSGRTANPCRARATGERASVLRSDPASRRPARTAWEHRSARVVTNVSGCLPRRARAAKCLQARARVSVVRSARVSGQRTWRNTYRAWARNLGRCSRNVACGSASVCPGAVGITAVSWGPQGPPLPPGPLLGASDRPVGRAG